MSFFTKLLKGAPKEEMIEVNAYESQPGNYGMGTVRVKTRKLVPKSKVEEIQKQTAEENSIIKQKEKEELEYWQEQRKKENEYRAAEAKQRKNAEVARCRQIIAEANASIGGKRRTRKVKRRRSKTRKSN